MASRSPKKKRNTEIPVKPGLAIYVPDRVEFGSTEFDGTGANKLLSNLK